MYVDFIVNDCSTVQTYFKRFAHTWPGVYYAQVLNDFPLLWVVKMFCLKKKKIFIIIGKIPIMNTCQKQKRERKS